MHASCTVTSVRAEVTLMTVPRSTSSAADNVHVSPWSRRGFSERERIRTKGAKVRRVLRESD